MWDARFHAWEVHLQAIIKAPPQVITKYREEKTSDAQYQVKCGAAANLCFPLMILRLTRQDPDLAWISNC